MKPSAFLIAALLALGGAAYGTPLTVTCVGDSSSTGDLVNAPVSCGQFNNALGTLTDITLDIAGEITGSITLTNNATQTVTATGTTTTTFDTNNAMLPGFAFVNPIISASITTGSVSLTPGETDPVTGLDSGVKHATDTQSSTFTNYEGPGSFIFDLSTTTGFSTTGGGGDLQATQATNILANATVTYDYTPASTVPEPDSLMLLGTGLAGIALGFFRRRRKG